MKHTLLYIICISLGSNCFAQTEMSFGFDTFEQGILAYKPVQKKNVSKEEYDYAAMILNETRKAVKHKPENFNLADYFNVLSAFLTLNESPENIALAYQKFASAQGSCEYFIAFENKIKNNPKYDLIRQNYNKQLQACKKGIPAKTTFDLAEYCERKNLDINLVKLMDKIKQEDEIYREQNWDQYQLKQKVIDQKNQQLIDSLFQVYGSYLGRSLVGKKYENVMWSVIQHSNVMMMEMYLPVIHKAYLDNEIEAGPLKMLIDRYYGLEYGYQIFGSQQGFGFRLADEQTRKALINKYELE